MTYKPNSLIHYGIPGQKWGIRRYQNEDGTLTPEGMRKYGVEGHLENRPKSDIPMSDHRQQQRPNGVNLNRKPSTVNDILRIRPHKGISPKKSAILNRIEVESQKKPSQKEDRHQKLISDYVNRGFTKEEAEKRASVREKVSTVLKIAGAVAVTAAVAYGAYKGRQYLKRWGNEKIKAGSDVFKVMGESNVSNHLGNYVTTSVDDAYKYKGTYGPQLQFLQNLGHSPKNGVYMLNGTIKKNTKIAGEKAGQKAYEALMKSDADFAAKVKTVTTEWNDKKAFAIPGWNDRTDYQKFNTMLTDHDTSGANEMASKFYNYLKDKGFGGVTDINDRLFSEYQSKKASILFNLKDNLASTKISKLTNIDIQEAATKSQEIHAKEFSDLLKSRNVARKFNKVKKVGIGAAVAGAVGELGLLAEKSSKGNNYSRYREIVKQYKKEHPNTKLTDSQIIENEITRDA